MLNHLARRAGSANWKYTIAAASTMCVMVLLKVMYAVTLNFDFSHIFSFCSVCRFLCSGLFFITACEEKAVVTEYSLLYLSLPWFIQSTDD